jgi:hypothetical protein
MATGVGPYVELALQVGDVHPQREQTRCNCVPKQLRQLAADRHPTALGPDAAPDRDDALSKAKFWTPVTLGTWSELHARLHPHRDSAQ